MPDIKHAFVSGIADGGDATLVRPSNWNALHAWPNAIDVGNLSLTTDGQFELQITRLQVSSTNRLTLAGATTRIVVFGATDGAIPNIIGFPARFTVPFRIPDGYAQLWLGRMILTGDVRGALQGDAEMRIYDDNNSSRYVLSGRG